jgi:uncharacterized Zn finger protein (UPF0148 family)
MPFRTLSCPSCGAPLPPNAKRTTVSCAFCKATVAWEEPLVRAADYREALAELDRGDSSASVTVAGMPYRILRRIAAGESSDVLLAERARRITERVVLKVTRAAEDADLLDNAWRVLRALHASTAHGTEHFGKLVPTPIARGIAQGLDLSGREVFVQRFMSGFVHTLDDVRRAHPQGVEPRHAVWLWRRMLETLDWVHRAGFVHGALLPQHVLVHARDHGVMLTGFSCAQPGGMPLRALQPAQSVFYPKHRGKIRLSTALDLGMVARNVLYVLGSDDGHTVPEGFPAPLAALLHATLDTSSTTIGAMDLAECVASAAKTAFGPPKFVVLQMPGWQ